MKLKISGIHKRIIILTLFSMVNCASWIKPTLEIYDSPQTYFHYYAPRPNSGIEIESRLVYSDPDQFRQLNCRATIGARQTHIQIDAGLGIKVMEMMADSSRIGIRQFLPKRDSFLIDYNQSQSLIPGIPLPMTYSLLNQLFAQFPIVLAPLKTMKLPKKTVIAIPADDSVSAITYYMHKNFQQIDSIIIAQKAQTIKISYDDYRRWEEYYLPSKTMIQVRKGAQRAQLIMNLISRSLK